MLERQTICFPHHGTQNVLQSGDHGFEAELHRLYSPAENEALEQVVALKKTLRSLPKDDFWPALTEGLSKILRADMTFIMKRVLVDDQDSAVEMPPIGTPGSCLMAAALHICAKDGSRTNATGLKFHAYSCPCAYMRHDKVFLIPERLGDFIINNPNKLPTPCEAYIAVPLFEDGKCFAHFGGLWSVEAALRRNLSWAFIELIMHSLEDMIGQRFVQGTDPVRSAAATDKPAVIPHNAITLAQSLRPYAGSLSHELRTPMQGIVGMLDVMYATVQETMDSQFDPRIRKIFNSLKENIETIQDSSRRAVEAADNVVHAYDMDMSVPAAPTLLEEPSELCSTALPVVDKRPEILVAGSNLPLSRPNKRRREDADSRQLIDGRSTKVSRLGRNPSKCRCSASDIGSEQAQGQSKVGPTTPDLTEASEDVDSLEEIPVAPHRIIAPGVRHADLREVVQLVINEALKVGGRPDSALAQETDNGEIIEVRTRGSDGTLGQKTIEWSIDPSVPTTMFIDEKDLSKLISCVFLNAIKFTDGAKGRISVNARMSSRGRYISIKIADNGPGIPSAFLPRLFKAFSQENGSLTRSSEGLGLGLMVAQGIARKLGGDLMCTRAETEGPHHGTEFEIKVPVQAGEIISRPGSPFGSPLPRKAQPIMPDTPHFKPLPAVPGDPRNLTRALHEVVGEDTFFQKPSMSVISTPPSPRSAALNEPSPPTPLPSPPSEPVKPIRVRPRVKKSVSNPEIDRDLANKYPLTFLVAEDNKINRKLLVSMLNKFGYKKIVEAHDGAEAVRQMAVPRQAHEQIDVVLMDLWMPLMDGYEATERILGTNGFKVANAHKIPTVLAVTADVTDGALERAAEVGMKGFMTKPYKLHDLQRLIAEYCATNELSTAPARQEIRV